MNREKPEDVALIGFVMLGVCCLFTLLLMPIAGKYEAISGWKWYLASYVILSCASQTEMNYLKVKGRNKFYAGISVLQTAVLASMNFTFLVFMGIGIRGYFMANILAQAVGVIITFFAADFGKDLKRANFRVPLLKRMILYSAPIILNNVSWWIINSLDKIMIEGMMNAAALGIYTVATKIPSLINVIISIFSQAWGLSTIKEIESSNDTGFYSSVFRMYSFITFGAGVAVVSIIKPFMTVYVGQEFEDAWKYVSLLVVSAVFYSISAYFGTLYNALQKTVNSMWTTLLCAAINTALNLIFIPVADVWGAIIGTVAAYFVIAHLRMFDVRRYVKITISWRKYVINAVLLIVQSILVALDWHIYYVSVAVILLFAANNIKEITANIEFVTKKIRTVLFKGK